MCRVEGEGALSVLFITLIKYKLLTTVNQAELLTNTFIYGGKIGTTSKIT